MIYIIFGLPLTLQDNICVRCSVFYALLYNGSRIPKSHRHFTTKTFVGWFTNNSFTTLTLYSADWWKTFFKCFQSESTSSKERVNSVRKKSDLITIWGFTSIISILKGIISCDIWGLKINFKEQNISAIGHLLYFYFMFSCSNFKTVFLAGNLLYLFFYLGPYTLAVEPKYSNNKKKPFLTVSSDLSV